MKRRNDRLFRWSTKIWLKSGMEFKCSIYFVVVRGAYVMAIKHGVSKPLMSIV